MWNIKRFTMSLGRGKTHRRPRKPGARVETLTRKYDSRVLMTEFTEAKIRRLIDEGVFYRVDMKEVDTVKVKGKDIPVKIFGIASKHTAKK